MFHEATRSLRVATSVAVVVTKPFPSGRSRQTLENNRESFPLLHSGFALVAREAKVDDDKKRVTLTNATVTKNATRGRGSDAGGIETVRGSLAIFNSIVSANSVAGGHSASADVRFVNSSHSATSVPSRSHARMLYPPPGQTITAAPFRFPSAG